MGALGTKQVTHIHKMEKKKQSEYISEDKLYNTVKILKF